MNRGTCVNLYWAVIPVVHVAGGDSSVNSVREGEVDVVGMRFTSSLYGMEDVIYAYNGGLKCTVVA